MRYESDRCRREADGVVPEEHVRCEDTDVPDRDKGNEQV